LRVKDLFSLFLANNEIEAARPFAVVFDSVAAGSVSSNRAAVAFGLLCALCGKTLSAPSGFNS
jgi:hypothetical protein